MNLSEELELQFSPSRWSRRYRAEDIVQKHIEFITKASHRAKKVVPCQLNIPYGHSEREMLDIFGTDLPSDSPIFVYIHGGDYWQELGREISSYVVEPLYKNEFKAIIVGYSLTPEVSLAQIVEQIKKAFLKCLDYAKKNSSRSLYVCGHSGGAHLVASLFQSFFITLPLEDQELLRGVFFISGIYDLIPLTKTYVNETLKLNSITAKKLSPLYHSFKANKNILFFVIVGENESPTFLEQSELFFRKLQGLAFTADFIVVKEVDHFDIVEQMNEENYEIIRLIINMEEY